jgi:hypothetical protein
LDLFDLSVVMQTLISSRPCTGVLAVADATGRERGRVWFLSGRVRSARFGNLQGRKAFHEILTSPARAGTFWYAEETPDAIHRVLRRQSEVFSEDPMTMILDAARQIDEQARR